MKQLDLAALLENLKRKLDFSHAAGLQIIADAAKGDKDAQNVIATVRAME